MSKFEELYHINVNDRKEDRDGLSYLSWAWAWAEFKKRCPDATYTVWRDEQGKPFVYDKSLGYMVFVSVTAENETHEMWLPVMDGKNKAMKDEPYEYTVRNKNFKYAKFDPQRNGYFDKYGNPQTEYVVQKVAAATMFDINKTIMRCLTKCLAMFGLGLYIYAGEDLPTIETEYIDSPNAMVQVCIASGITPEGICRYYGVADLSQLIPNMYQHFNNNREFTINEIKKRERKETA